MNDFLLFLNLNLLICPKQKKFTLFFDFNREIRFVSLVLLNRYVFDEKKKRKKKKGISGDMEKLVVSRSHLFQ